MLKKCSKYQSSFTLLPCKIFLLHFRYVLKDLLKYSIIDEVKNVEDISYFEELIFKVGMLGEKRAKYTFDNGLTLSVVAGENQGYYGNGKTSFEVAVLDQENKFMTKEFENSFDDVLGWQTPDQITKLITKIKNYEQK